LKEVEAKSTVEIEVLDDKEGSKSNQTVSNKLEGPPAVPKLSL
jgi:hypothetical protein